MRSATGSAPKSRSESRTIQCDVARLPASTPAAPSSSEPVQTEVVHLDVSLGSAQPFDCGRAVDGLPRSGASGDDDHIGCGNVFERVLRGQDEADMSSLRSGRRGDESCLGAREAGENLVGADEVERSHFFVEKEGDLSHGRSAPPNVFDWVRAGRGAQWLKLLTCC